MTKVTSGNYPEIEAGAKVKLNPYYVEEGKSQTRYFVMELSKGFCLLADNKRMYERGEGYIYSVWDILEYQTF